MRLLHTSDWHLGATLEGVSRDADHALFLDWLGRTVVDERVDVLVVAGDVFDQAHPSAEAQRQYFRFLKGISGGALRKVVIVGGNHDSAARLDAPREILDALDVHVVGGLLADESTWDRCLCTIPDPRGGAAAVVLAVPFVHEYRLGIRTVLASPEEIREAFREKLRGLYGRLLDRATAQSEGAPVIATGHLTCDGWEKGDAPADIHQVGTIGGLPADVFDARIQYVALGHIHRSYRVGESRAYYSGSPIALSLKEGRTARSVRIVETADGEGAASVRRLEVPAFRQVLELKGAPSVLAERLRALTWEEPLPPIVFAVAEVERYSGSVEELLRSAASARGEAAPRLVQVRQATPATVRTPETATPVTLADLSPEDVFRRLCADRDETPDDALLTAFRSLLTAPERAS